MITFVPGWLGEAADFDLILGHLREALDGRVEYRIHEVAGLGTRYREDPKSLEACANDLLQDTRPGSVLCAYSMGARIGLVAALRAPRHFAELVLCGVHPGLTSEQERDARRDLDRLRADSLTNDPQTFLTDWYDQPLFDAVRRHPAFMELESRRRTLASDDARVRGAARTLLACSLADQPCALPAPATLPPSTLVVGSLDSKFVEIANRMHDAAPATITVRTIANRGHALLTEAPREVAGILRESLVRIGETTPLARIRRKK
ncbi:MAG: alpha/beta fold hydrolase [Planctomycetes bacterium]|nr:alpha/beta fold hydrolase [Planctomycetota bacterium]MCB9917829.1 alpha/beta fold hydrolase [Planctomycetota bacterium]